MSSERMLARHVSKLLKHLKVGKRCSEMITYTDAACNKLNCLCGTLTDGESASEAFQWYLQPGTKFLSEKKPRDLAYIAHGYLELIVMGIRARY